jgi:hypothetical protein
MVSERPRMLVVYEGREMRGFLLHRGKRGWEAFSADERSLGIFRTEHEAAANALTTQRRSRRHD